MEDDKSKIEHLRDLLYSPSSPDKIHAHRRKLTEGEYSVPDNWEGAGIDELTASTIASADESLRPKKHSSLFGRLLIGAVFFFILCAGVAAYVYFFGINTVSPDKIDITFNGPISAPAAEPLVVNVDITNRNTASLILTDMLLDYPDGSRQPQNIALPQINDLVSVGTIEPGATSKQQIQTVLFGDQNTTKTITVTLQYHIDGSNAVFTKQKTYQVALSSPPVSLTIDALKEINSNQVYQMTMHVVSNSPTTLKNLLVSVTYPFGFKYASSTPTPVVSSSANIFKIGDLEPGGKRDITIKGVITGQNTDQRVFVIKLGIEDETLTNKMGTVFLASAQSVNIKQPFLASSIVLDGDSSDTHVVSIGNTVTGQIVWKNNLTVPVTDTELKLSLNGRLLQQNRVYSDAGYYNSEANTITFNKLTNKDLESIPAGASGAVAFSFSTEQPSVQLNSSITNPTIKLDLDVSGKRLSENLVPEDITTTDSKTVQIAANVGIGAFSTYSTGPFTNSGPIPPKVGQKTSYTVTWSLTNTFNITKGVIVTASLPIYVNWLGSISPSSEKISYNANNHTISWNVGDLPAGLGFKNSPRQVSFQVSLTPSVSQVGNPPVLVTSAHIAGTDSFTGKALTADSKQVTTSLTNDPAYSFGSDNVTN